MCPLDVTNFVQGPSHDDPFGKFNTKDSPILFPVAEREVGWRNHRTGAYERLNTHKAIVRVAPSGDTAMTLDVVGINYRLVHNHELFSHVEHSLCKQMQRHALDGVQVKDRVSGWGRTCFREYVFPNMKCQLGGGTRSEIALRLIVQNGYGGSALRVHAGAIEFYCSNGMISGEYQSSYRKHTKGLVIADFNTVLNKALDAFTTNQDRWRQWAQTPVRPLDAMELFRQLASSDKLRENLGNQYMRERDVRGENLWSVYSALTYYASHSDGEFALRSTVNEQDTVASTMLQRELNVSKWTNTDAWRKLELT